MRDLTMFNTHLMENERIWKLLARKFAAEITADELQELTAMLHDNPGLHYTANVLAEWWQQDDADGGRENTEAKLKVEKFKTEIGIGIDQSKIFPSIYSPSQAS